MPHRKWSHRCAEEGEARVWLAVAVCPECGRTGEDDGWHYSLTEVMAAYQRLYRLKAVGPHRPLADTLFAGAVRECEVCRGRGVVDTPDNPAECVACAACQGARQVFVRAPSEIEALRQQVLSAYPQAAAE
jgi:hypothetical protein